MCEIEENMEYTIVMLDGIYPACLCPACVSISREQLIRSVFQNVLHRGDICLPVR
jgi:hypothetical protein